MVTPVELTEKNDEEPVDCAAFVDFGVAAAVTVTSTVLTTVDVEMMTDSEVLLPPWDAADVGEVAAAELEVAVETAEADEPAE